MDLKVRAVIHQLCNTDIFYFTGDWRYLYRADPKEFMQLDGGAVRAEDLTRCPMCFGLIAISELSLYPDPEQKVEDTTNKAIKDASAEHWHNWVSEYDLKSYQIMRAKMHAKMHIEEQKLKEHPYLDVNKDAYKINPKVNNPKVNTVKHFTSGDFTSGRIVSGRIINNDPTS